jgi:hypothetical protein
MVFQEELLARKTAILATSERIEAYGGHQLSETVLADFADQMMKPGFVMNLDHDPREPVGAKVIRAWTERHSEGYLLLKAEFEASPDQWERTGDRVGMSLSYTEPIAEVRANTAFTLAADAYWFDESSMRLAATALGGHGHEASILALYQFAHDPDAWVYLTVIADQLKGVPGDLLSAMIWDALKGLLNRFSTKRREVPDAVSTTTKIQMTVNLPDGTSSSMHVETESADEVKYSVDAFVKIIRQAGQG